MKFILILLISILTISCSSSNKIIEPKVWTYEEASKVRTQSISNNELKTDYGAIEWIDKSLNYTDSESFYPFRADNSLVFKITYPEEARKKNETGLVRLTFEIDETGSTSNFTLLKKASPSLDQMVIDVLNSTVFIPGFCNKTATKTLAIFQFVFDLPTL